MAAKRDDFTKSTKTLLANKVAFRCSNPGCRKLTYGPAMDRKKYLNIGVAAHIRAAAPNGPRYGASMTREQRKDESNGIWLCQCCAKLIDSDAYTVELLESWKQQAEEETHLEIENRVLENDNRICRLKDIRKAIRNFDSVEEYLKLSMQICEEADKLAKKLEEIHEKLLRARDDSDHFRQQIYEAQFDTLMLLLYRLRDNAEAVRFDAARLYDASQNSCHAPAYDVMYSAGYGGGGNTYKCLPDVMTIFTDKATKVVEELVHICYETDCLEQKLMEYDLNERTKLLALMIELENSME